MGTFFNISEVIKAMMSYVFGGIIIIGVICGLASGRASEVSASILSEGGNAVALAIKLLGMMCLWSGMMQIAERSKLTDKISSLLSPLTTRLFTGLKATPALKLISMNMVANLLGLGNAATPLGIMAMQELEKQDKTTNVASDNMITFVVLNTASLQLIPTTTAMLRLSYGSANPMEILLPAWIASFASILTALFCVKYLYKSREGQCVKDRKLHNSVGGIGDSSVRATAKH